MPPSLPSLLNSRILNQKSLSTSLHLIAASLAGLGFFQILQHIPWYYTLSQRLPSALANTLPLLILHTCLLIFLIYRFPLRSLKRPYFSKLREPRYARLRTRLEVAVLCVYMMGVFLLTFIFSSSSPTPSETYFLITHETHPFIAWFVVALWVPVVEELLFRGYLTAWIYHTAQKHPLAPVSSAIIFTLLHVSVLSVIEGSSLPLGPLSIGLTCELLRSGSLRWHVPIGVHIIANSTVYLWAYWAPDLLEYFSMWYLI